MKKITKEDRYLIEKLLNEKYTVKQLSEIMKKDSSVIYRKIKRVNSFNDAKMCKTVKYCNNCSHVKKCRKTKLIYNASYAHVLSEGKKYKPTTKYNPKTIEDKVYMVIKYNSQSMPQVCINNQTPITTFYRYLHKKKFKI